MQHGIDLAAMQNAYEHAQRVLRQFQSIYPADAVRQANEFLRQNQGITAAGSASALAAARNLRSFTPDLSREMAAAMQAAMRAHARLSTRRAIPASVVRAAVEDEIPDLAPDEAAVVAGAIEVRLPKIIEHVGSDVSSEASLEQLAAAVADIRYVLVEQLPRSTFERVWEHLYKVLVLLAAILTLALAYEQLSLSDQQAHQSTVFQQEQVERQGEANRLQAETRDEVRKNTAAVEQVTSRLEELNSAIGSQRTAKTN